MIIINILSRRSDYQLRIMTLNDAVTFYTRDETLLEDFKLNIKLEKYKNQLMLNEKERVYHKDSSFNS